MKLNMKLNLEVDASDLLKNLDEVIARLKTIDELHKKLQCYPTVPPNSGTPFIPPGVWYSVKRGDEE
jgi:hypothetical protein